MEAVNAGLTAGVHFSAAQEWGLWGRATVFCPRSYEGKLLGAAFRLVSKVSPPSLQGLSRPLSGAKGQTEGSGALENSGTPRGREPRSLNDHMEHSPAAQISLGHREEINLYCVG